jgi:radical SAM superfamily enzyme YgiQ (UPF0313 family)
VTDSSKPSILLAYPSCYYLPREQVRAEIKTSQLLLASYLAQSFPVEYADFEISIGRPTSEVQIRRFERKVRTYLDTRDFDILALSCWTSLSYKATLATAQIARELYPDCLIVVGGYHPSARPDDFRTSDNVIDYVVCGEGELALTDIARRFSAHGRPSQTEVVDGPALQPEDYVEVTWDLANSTTKSTTQDGFGTICVYLSRGCPFNCSFCVESLKEQSWRPHTPLSAIEEIRTAAERYHPAAIAIGDACFGVRSDWRKEFLRRLADLAPSYWVFFETRPEYLDPEDIAILQRLRVMIQFGIESCSPTILRLMNKAKQPDKYLARFRETSDVLSRNGVLHGANLIFNHPGETQQTLEETFAFIDTELETGGSSLIWTGRSYMHFPGSELDRNQSFYEREFGSAFLSPEWWRGDKEPLASSRRVIPSSDLQGGRTDLWKRMYESRDENFRKNLTTQTFRFAADTYFPEWRRDPRYEHA